MWTRRHGDQYVLHNADTESQPRNDGSARYTGPRDHWTIVDSGKCVSWSMVGHKLYNPSLHIHVPRVLCCSAHTLLYTDARNQKMHLFQCLLAWKWCPCHFLTNCIFIFRCETFCNSCSARVPKGNIVLDMGDTMQGRVRAGGLSLETTMVRERGRTC